ncbi:MAG: guanylate kinase [Candidatus Eisenbacteria bacterium]
MDSLPTLHEPSFPIVVSGPSGVGKTVLCRGLVARASWTCRSISATTREPRPGEVDGESYFFRSRGAFEEERASGRMAEWAEVHGELYGTPRSFLERELDAQRSVVLNIDVQGGLQIRQVYPESVLIFLLPPTWEVLEERLRNRATDGEEQMRRRLDRARREAAVLPEYDYVVVNDVLETAIDELVTIVSAERARVWRRLGSRALRADREEFPFLGGDS